MIQAVLFDLDDTLMPDEAAADAALLAVAEAARATYDIPPESLRRSVRIIARRVWRAHPLVAARGDYDISSWEALSARFEGADQEMTTLRAWAREFRYRVWTEALAEIGHADPALAERLAELYPVERRARYEPFPDVKPMLAELHGNWKLGLVSNGPVDLQWEKMQKSGLDVWFQAVVVSREVGVWKPDPRIFTIALERLSAEAAKAVHVGDSLARDVAGAKAAGLKTVWLDRSGEQPPVESTLSGSRDPIREDVRPDARVEDLSELPAIVRAWGGRGSEAHPGYA